MTLLLNYNYFEFDQKHFRQLGGTAMGAKMAPKYAKIFMASLEILFIEKQPNKPLFYRRFLDDIILVCNHAKASLLEFISAFNCLHQSIKFIHEISQHTSVPWMLPSGTWKLPRDHSLQKTMDRQQYLYFDSDHPRHCKVSIPYSQAYRYRRICSETEEFERNSHTLKDTLLNQNYTKRIIDDAINRARQVDRQSALSENNAQKGPHPRQIWY